MGQQLALADRSVRVPRQCQHVECPNKKLLLRLLPLYRSCKQALSERSDIVYTLVLCARLFPGFHCRLHLPTATVPPRAERQPLFPLAS
jgi:hypothetical protein